MTKSVNIRELVLDTLLEVAENGTFSHIVIRDVLMKYQYLDKKDRAFYTRVSQGTLERMVEIDYIIDQFSKTKTKKMKPVIRNLLRSGVYQLLFMNGVPDSAVCNETVKLTGKRGFMGLKGFVNGLLRTISREKNKITYPDKKEEPVHYLSIRYSMPEWLTERWVKEYGPEKAEIILRGLLEKRPTTIRCNRKKNTPDELKELLLEEGVQVRENPYLPYAFEICGYDFLNRLQTFREGRFQVQDVSSMLAVEASVDESAGLVMDVCAAPGGKCLHAADKLTNGRVLAFDLTEAKVSLIRENIARSGVSNITPLVRDAAALCEEDRESADVVLADLPCSGLGVIGRKTDIKYKTSESDIYELAGIQREILAQVQNYVKPGGILLYSTCTIAREENELNRKWFLNNFPFEPASLDEYLCEELHSETTEDGYLQLLPGVHRTDGFFLAKMRKKEE